MRLKKALGQHILTDGTIIQKIVGAVSLKATDTILEIGPGTGVLTQQLAGKVKLLLAVEKDFRMVHRLRDELKNKKEKVKITHQDILGFDETLIDGDYKVVGNLPYNITSPIIRKFLESKHPPVEMTLMIQKEVAERITAPPGSSDRGVLTVMVEYYGSAEILFEVPRTSFLPIPKVDSAVVRIHPRGGVAPAAHLGVVFFRVVKAGFSAKRRQIHNSLAGGLGLPQSSIHAMLKKAEIDEKQRAEDLSLDQWQRLAQLWQDRFGHSVGDS